MTEKSQIDWRRAIAPYAKRARQITYSAVKRTADVTLASTVLVATAPVMIGTAVAIRSTMGGPVIFRQQRPGRYGHFFEFYKFRTMRSPAPGEDPVASHGERVTKLGSFLRKYSIDELPNLFNVLKGDMSLVGPRPLLMEHVPRYTAEQFHRHDVPPGITGWAQINGRNDQTWQAKFEYDLWYVNHRSLWLDAKILGKTVTNVLLSKGVSPDGYEPMPDFRAMQMAASDRTPNSKV